jgi:hypothetical protein
MGFVPQICVVCAVVFCPIIVWRGFGNADALIKWGPVLLALLGIKLFKGTNGRIYAEPPPPLKRLQLSLLFGLLWAAVALAPILAVWNYFDLSR